MAGGHRVRISGEPCEDISFSAGFSDYRYDPNGEYWIEQSYVQYFIPHQQRLALPVVLVHGGGLTGSCWETHPDCRMGWQESLIRRGVSTYVADSVERGRAGFAALPGTWSGRPLQRSAEESWSLFRIGKRADFAARRPFDGSQFPLEAFDDLVRQTVPRWLTNTEAQIAALVAVVRIVGPCYLVGHSQGGGHAMAVAEREPELVRATVALEPHGGPSRFERAAGRPMLHVQGDFIDRDDTWTRLARSAKESVKAWRDGGGVADTLDLPREGLMGNSHMLMMDRNSETVLDLVMQWLTRIDASHSNLEACS
ncbi:alpha/beta fold hydrolase [Rhizobium cauense]|uniref:alpha/beta fold hydrolase n=1 Tax=Rhizobium cauense TaxID=1166683 RepID=UPI001C6E6457|nr:alpha/beta fold hydrolase [Rhizobium cauense]MBW9116439.1 alpha/beta fold hydrolase [Rhizobium cauense]